MTALKCFLLDHGYTSQNSAPCCHMLFTGPLPTSFTNMHTNRHYIEIKQSMDRGVWHKACNDCQIVEERNVPNVQSKRQLVLDHYNNTKCDGLIDLTLAPGYLCNLQCRSCNPWLSSSWVAEYQTPAMAVIDHDGHPNWIKSNRLAKTSPAPVYNYDDDDWSTVKYVNFVGGEPLYNPEFYKQLEKIANDTNGDCVISITTNATVVLDINKYHWLSKFKEIHIGLSIDSVGRSAEFIRTGTVWSKVAKNIEFYKSVKMFSNTTEYHLTNSVLNLLETHATVTWLESRGIPRCGLVTHVTGPAHLTYSVLTDAEKQEIVKRLAGTRAEYIIPVLDEYPFDPVNRTNFLRFMEHTKNYHGMDWKDYLPDLYNIMNEA